MNIVPRVVSVCVVAAIVACGARAQESKPRRFLVVAPEALAPAARDFVAVKSKRMPTELVTLEAVLAASKGVDDAEKLKLWIYQAWREQNVAWVLLVGDADVMPVRYMVLDRVTPAAFDYAFYPSDLYYADLADVGGAFDDWNRVKDGFHGAYFGEVRGEKNKKDPINYDGVDYRPEIAVGRWPVSTPEATRVVAEKSLARDALADAREPWMDRVGLVMVGGWIDARPAMDEVARLLGSGRTIEKRYYADAGAPAATAPPTEAEVSKLLEAGVGFLAHAGHGSDDTWEQCLPAGAPARLKNSRRLPIMMSAGCSTARFAVLPPYEAYVDVHGVEHRGTNAGEVFTAPPPAPAVYQRGRFNMTGLGERLVRDTMGGAAAYIGCNTGSQPAALSLLEGFAKELGQSKTPRVGDCFSAAMRHYFEVQHLATIAPTEDWYPASIFFQGMKFMLFGDPTLRM